MKELEELLKSEAGKALLISLLEENLRLYVDSKGGDYGSSKYLEVKIEFAGTVVASETAYLS